MKRLFLILPLLALWSAILCADVSAQQGQNPFAGKPPISLAGHDPAERVALARKLIRSHNYQGAADVLELTLETNPDDGTVVNLLKGCYDQLKQYDKEETLLRRVLERTPDATGYRLSLAETLVRQGRPTDGAAEYRTVAAKMGTPDPSRQILIIRSMMTVGQDSLALWYIDDFRRASHDSLLFGAERGNILEGRAQYADAAREYLRTLNLDTSSNSLTAENRLLDLLAFPASAVAVEQAVSRHADSSAGIRTLSLLADHYLRAEDYDRAFALSVRLDSLGGGIGAGLLHYLQACQERKKWAQVARMSDYMLTRRLDSKFQMPVEFARAEALVELKQFPEAIELFKRLSADAESERVRGDALYGLGVLYSEHMHDPRTALVYFDSVLSTSPRGFTYLNSALAQAHCYLRLGDTAASRQKFTAFRGNMGPETMLEEAAYFLGLISFFEGQYDSTSVQMRRLMVSYPRGFYVNDALALLMVMRDAQDADTLLGEYSSALFYQQQERYDSARVQLLRVVDAGNKVLADVALYRLATMEAGRSDSTAAVETIDRLIGEFPESYYRPLGMKFKADVLFDGKRDMEQARELYRQLLESYPDYPFTGDVREKLRALEAQKVVG